MRNFYGTNDWNGLSVALAIVALAIIINLAIIVVAHFFTNWVANFSMRYLSKIL